MFASKKTTTETTAATPSAPRTGYDAAIEILRNLFTGDPLGLPNLQAEGAPTPEQMTEFLNAVQSRLGANGDQVTYAATLASYARTLRMELESIANRFDDCVNQLMSRAAGPGIVQLSTIKARPGSISLSDGRRFITLPPAVLAEGNPACEIPESAIHVGRHSKGNRVVAIPWRLEGRHPAWVTLGAIEKANAALHDAARSEDLHNESLQRESEAAAAAEVEARKTPLDYALERIAALERQQRATKA